MPTTPTEDASVAVTAGNGASGLGITNGRERLAQRVDADGHHHPADDAVLAGGAEKGGGVVSKWVGGLAEWHDGDTCYLSVAFTWKLDEAYSRALFAKALGMKVMAGGPALFLSKMQHQLTDVAEIGTHYPDAIRMHNSDATIASRGCPVGCHFCIVPAMEGREFTLLDDFEDAGDDTLAAIIDTQIGSDTDA